MVVISEWELIALLSLPKEDLVPKIRTSFLHRNKSYLYYLFVGKYSGKVLIKQVLQCNGVYNIIRLTRRYLH